MDSASIQALICSTCEKQFPNHLLLRKHISVHSSLSAYPCTQCPDSFKQIKHLNFHIKNSHQDYYNSLYKTPLKINKPWTQVKENSSSSEDSFKPDPDLTSKDSSKNLETSLKEETGQNLKEKQLEIAVPRAIYLTQDRADQNLFWKIQGRKKTEDLKGINWMFFDSFIKLSNKNLVGAGKPVKNPEIKGFVQLKEEKCGRDPKVLQVNASKRIEFLEENIRKSKLQEASIAGQIEAVRASNKELEDEIRKIKRKYKNI